jgi:hypothetical protein
MDGDVEDTKERVRGKYKLHTCLDRRLNASGTLRESFFPMDAHLDSSLISNNPLSERLVVQTIFIKLFGIAAAITLSTALSRSLTTVQEIEGYH